MTRPCALLGEIFTFIFVPHKIGKEIERLIVAVKPLTRNGFDRRRGNIADLTEALALRHVGDMHFDCRDADTLDRVRNGDARVGVGGGVEDDAVRMGEICVLYGVDQIALVVGLNEFDLNAQLLGMAFDELYEVVVGLPAVYIRLTDAENVNIRPVEN